jgi:predicted nucleic acid-binding Zn ribbon protein
LQRGNDQMARCLKCDSMSIDRLLPRVGVIYKGNGYHSTDYRTTCTRRTRNEEHDSKTEERGTTGEDKENRNED